MQIVRTAAELEQAVSGGVPHIVVDGVIAGMPSIVLQPGQTLSGGALQFGASGVQLSRDNTLENIVIRTNENERAILIDPTSPALGTLTLRDVRTVGQVSLLSAASSGHVQVERLHVERADVRGRMERPHAFGVDAMQGAFALWNTGGADANTTAELLEISAGSTDAPVRGSGIFVAGRVTVSTLTTGEIHTDGGIAPGTPDLISGGVFVVTGATVDRVDNLGAVTTHGQNDMVLDNWGEVREWTARAPLVSHGPSAMGFVQFGRIGTLVIDAPIDTFGEGARGFNIFAGSLDDATFRSIRTHAGGGVGIAVAAHVPRIRIREGIETKGGTGPGLVKGRFQPLQANAFVLQPDAVIDDLDVGGALRTSGDVVVTLQADAAKIGRLQVRGGIHASGMQSDGVVLKDGAQVPLDGIDITATDGERIRIEPGPA